MNGSTGSLLGQGLVIAAVGMGLVFAVLVLMWGMVALLQRLAPVSPPPAPEPDSPSVEQGEAAALTAERAQVAAVVAGALMANALPLHLEPPVGPTFEHGRTAPIWVTANRSRTLQSWQPPRPSDQ
jgi:Na+-transporting methylmalonyl-CoA/oxaloacetate decarboxylase gamma subunit